MQFSINCKVLHSGITLSEAKELFSSYEMKVSAPENYSKIILYGRLILDKIDHEVVVHMYFSKDCELLNSMVIHPFPINFDKLQTYLEQQIGIEGNVIDKTNVRWLFDDGEIQHSIIDRFGEEEMIYLSFEQ